jgi:tetratricopeptide (TPR) repeat protein
MIDAVLQQEPANSKALIIKGDILKQQGRPQDAEQALQRALNTSSDKKAVLDQLLAVYKAQGDTAKLRQGWERYAATFPQDADVQYQAGLTLHEAKAYDGAIQYYQKAIQLKPNFADAYANLGTAYHALKKDDDALKALKKAAQLNPNLEEVQTLIAALESQKGSQAFYEAAKLHEQGQYREALKQYEIAIKEDPKNADIQARYGLALQALKRFPEAVAAYDKAIALQPDVAAHYYYKGSVYDEQNQLAPARQLYEKALSLDPQLEQAKSALAALQTASTDTTLAESADAYDKKNYVLALQKADAAIKSDPNNAMAYYYKGLALEAQKKLEPARLAYQKSVELDPAMSDAVYALAVVLDTQGKKADAQKTFQQFLTLTKDQPEDDFIKYAKSRLN